MLLTYLNAVPPGTLLGKALHYLSSQWPKLVRYVDYGAWPIDNSLCENAIRPFVVGRRNWLFSDTVGGVNASNPQIICTTKPSCTVREAKRRGSG